MTEGVRDILQMKGTVDHRDNFSFFKKSRYKIQIVSIGAKTTPGGMLVANKSYMNYMEGRLVRTY